MVKNMEKNVRTIQTTGGYSPDLGYSLSICITDTHCITVDGLSKEDMLEIKSCVDCMLLD
jgi:hypothetical protein